MSNTLTSKLNYFLQQFEDKRISLIVEITRSKKKFQLLQSSISRIISSENEELFLYSENNLESYFDNLKKNIDALKLKYSEKRAKEIEKTVENIFSILSINYFQSLDILFTKFNSLEEVINEGESKVLHLEERLRKGIDNLRELKENKIIEFSSLEKDFKKRIQETESQSNNLSSQFRSELNDAKNAQINAFDKFYSENQNKSQDLLKNMKAKNKEVNKYYNFTKNIMEAGGFNLAARNENSNANMFRIIAFVLMTIVAGIMVWLTVESLEQINNNDTIVLFSSLLRFLLVFTLMIPAAYASREANRHRSNAELYTLMAAEMASIDNYVSKLPKNMRYTIKEKLAEKYFGHFRLIGKFKNMTATDELRKLIRELKIEK